MKSQKDLRIVALLLLYDVFQNAVISLLSFFTDMALYKEHSVYDLNSQKREEKKNESNNTNISFFLSLLAIHLCCSYEKKSVIHCTCFAPVSNKGYLSHFCLFITCYQHDCLTLTNSHFPLPKNASSKNLTVFLPPLLHLLDVSSQRTASTMPSPTSQYKNYLYFLFLV